MLAIGLAGVFLACGKTEVPASSPVAGRAQTPSASSDAASGAPNAETPGDAWRNEMEREVAIPAHAQITIGELAGRIAFASTRSGPHTVFTLSLGADAEPERLGYGMEPVWSPDGTAIAFVSSFLDGGDEITVMNADGSDVRRLTTTEGQDRGPTWSPDGRSIAFWSERDGGEREIYMVATDGSVPRRLTSNSANDMWPAFSPDGSEVAFESYRGDGAEIFAVSVDGGSERRITPRSLDAREPAWSPDGSEIAFVSSTSRGWALVVMVADGRSFRKLAEAKSIRNPSWSPDGRFLIFALTSTSTANEDIGVVDAAGGRLANLTNDGGGYDWDPSWCR